MTYQETLDWMFSKLPMYQNQGQTAFKKTLSNSIALSKYLGFPEQKFQSIHVGGTNGKGSTSHMLASILQEAGYKVGLYTSPHLKNFTERIRINGIEIPAEKVVAFVEKHQFFFEKNSLSFFEMTVGLAFDFFADEQVDVAIIEVGLGGRLDSTNIITPIISVITNIGLDHTQILGNTLQEIAKEKAGIIKKEVPVVIGEFQQDAADVFLEIATKHNSKVIFASEQKFDFKTDLLGIYQKHNTKTAVTVIQQLKKFNVSQEHITNGLLRVVQNTNLKGRWQVLGEKPKVICDTAHNKEGLQYVLKQLLEQDYQQLHIVLGMVSDKDIDLILPLFPKKATYYFCKPNIQRGLCQEKLRDKALDFGLFGEVFSSVNEAFDYAKKVAVQKDMIYIGGSTFVVAEVV